TVTDAGTVRAVLSSETATVAPPVGAIADNVTAQLEVPPDVTVAGVHCNPVIVGGTATGATVTDAVFKPPFHVAVTVTVCFPAPVPPVAVKWAVAAPAATVTDAGTVRAVLLSDSVTRVPLAA